MSQPLISPLISNPWSRSRLKEKLEQLALQMHRSGVGYSAAVREFQKMFLATVLREQNGNQVFPEIVAARTTIACAWWGILPARAVGDGVGRTSPYSPNTQSCSRSSTTVRRGCMVWSIKSPEDELP
jgi:hypothetical protein